jgi:fructan beta-fructosidase
MKYILYLSLLICTLGNSQQSTNESTVYKEQFRPQIHFSPKEKWMNDPNGMFYYNKTYHLFFQHNPDSTVWGPMHWAHATSSDMIHWVQQPIALYPDSLGTIFSGSAVVDLKNTSGFGKNGKVPIVAIYTYDPPRRRNESQYQAIAYSLDEGKTWTKYEGNPVLKSPGVRDFRDPKVSWYAAGNKWIMILATKDRVTFYSSPNLKEWTRESDFGSNLGAHGGVWECPDLLSFDYNGKKVWALLSSINPGGPNGGSATQYFIGDFDGKTFSPYDTLTRWIDYGTDNYAGVTFSNTGPRRVFMGWMSNWQYANKVPTGKWRSAMTIPREMELRKVNGKLVLNTKPVKELASIEGKITALKNITVTNEFVLSDKLNGIADQYKITLAVKDLADFSMEFYNKQGEKMVFGYDISRKQFYLDRTLAGQSDFDKNFAKKIYAPRISGESKSDITIIVDAASIEVFADGGLTVMTGIFFPNKKYDSIKIKSDKLVIPNLWYFELKSIWN